ncbi:phage tail protein [Acinetobacter sp. AG3]|uniref:phage tail protein n=1 Tax=unclassified Acinetobacter TaxID=196816 RepID=UPI001EF0FAC5|nr:phage tail protein [Acinetobacter sp. AG3]MCG7219486.1 phage tail protein [Acinetobacter sp. AG3]
MAAQYHSLFTTQGLALLREAIQNGTKLGITHMAYGDGNGIVPTPNADFTKLIKEVYRTPLNRLAPSKENANWLEADGVIPSAVGGFNIREVGLYAGNILVAYANYPATYKPSADQGTAQIKTIRIVLQIDNTANFELKIDASVVMATIQSVEEAKQAAILHADQTKIEKVESLSNLNQIEHINGRMIQTKSWWPDLNTGGLRYSYSETTAKNLHNGGTIIDPDLVFPASFSALPTYLQTKTTTGNGCYIAVNVKETVPAEIFGAFPSDTHIYNDAAINAALTAAQATTTTKAKKVTIGVGNFYTSNAVIITSTKHIIPPKLIGAGREATILIKTTTNPLGSGYLASSTADAVLVSSPRSDNPEGGAAYLISEEVKGLSLKHKTEAVNSLGWLRHRSAMGYVDDIYAEYNHTHFIFNDCWMTNFGQLWCHGGTLGYIFDVGTSLRGGQLYATATKGRAFLFSKVIYSDLKCCADGCGTEGLSGATCYEFVDCKGVSGKFNSEGHRGKAFSFSGSYGMQIGGQDWRAKAVDSSATVNRISLSYSIVKFVAFDFLESATSLTTAQRKNYELYTRDDISVLEFDCCALPQQEYGLSDQKPIHSILNNKAFFSKFVDSRFNQINRQIQHIINISTSYKALCYVGKSSRLIIQSANSLDPNQPYFCYVDDDEKRKVGIIVSTISKNEIAPTEIATIYVDFIANKEYSTKLLGYVGTDGWLYVKSAADWYSLDYAFNLII